MFNFFISYILSFFLTTRHPIQLGAIDCDICTYGSSIFTPKIPDHHEPHCDVSTPTIDNGSCQLVKSSTQHSELEFLSNRMLFAFERIMNIYEPHEKTTPRHKIELPNLERHIQNEISQFKKQLKESLSEGKLKNVIDELLIFFEDNEELEPLNEVVILSSTFNELEKRDRLSMITYERVKEGKAKLTSSVIQIIDNQI